MAEKKDESFNEDSPIEIPADADKESKEIAQEISDEEAAKKKEEEGGEDQKKEETGEEKEPEEKESGQEEEEEKDKEKEGEEEEGAAMSTLPMWQLRKIQKELGKAMAEQFGKQLTEIADQIKEIKGASAEKKEEAAEKLDDLAEKYGLDPNFVNELGARLSKQLETKVQLPKEVETTIKDLKEEQFWKEQDVKFEDEFSALLKDEEFSELPLKTIKAQLYDLAFYNEKYANYSLSDILRLEAKNLFKTGKKSGTSSRGGSSSGPALDLTKPLSPDEINELTDKQFDEYSENMAKISRGQIVRKGQEV